MFNQRVSSAFLPLSQHRKKRKTRQTRKSSRLLPRHDDARPPLATYRRPDARLNPKIVSSKINLNGKVQEAISTSALGI